MNATVVKSILEQRPFLKMADLHALLSKTLSKEQLADLYGKMFVQINVNTASDEEILLIPGAGSRMTREFRDKRPYKTLAQFRNEIGKSADPKEVALLEQYVFVPINLNSASDDDICRFPAPVSAWYESSRNTAPGLPSNSSAKRSASTSTRRKWRGWKSTSRSIDFYYYYKRRPGCRFSPARAGQESGEEEISPKKSCTTESPGTRGASPWAVTRQPSNVSFV